MTAGRLLDADMTTIGRMIAQGFRWWIDELAALVPPRWRGDGGDRGPQAWYDGTLHAARDGRPIGPLAAAARGPATILIAPDLCLTRTLDRPAVSPRDLARMLALDGDRIMPMPAGSMLVAGRVASAAADGVHVVVEAAGLPIGVARDLLAAAAAADIVPVRVALDPPTDPAARIDFLPAMRDAGLIVGDRSVAATWWAVVAFLFALNLGLLIWRDHASVARLRQIVDAQRPAVSVARAIGARVAGADRIARASADARARHDALGMLAGVTRALPDGAWVQRLSWDGASVRLAGYRARDANVVTALRAAPGFAGVRNTSSDAVAEVPAGQPFDVTARLTGALSTGPR